MADKRSVGFGRPVADEAPAPDAATAPSDAPPELDDDSMAELVPERDKRGHKGSFGRLLVLAGSLDYAGAALLVCRAAGRAGAGLVTLAVPESLQPLFAAKVVEATTMALPEDDVEEVDPEPALASVLDHEHDALVIGPGLRPSLAIGGAAAADPHRVRGGRRAARGARRRGAADAGRRRRVVDAGDAPVRAHAAHRRVRPAARRQRPRRRRRTATSAPTTPPARVRRRPPPREWHQVVVLKGAKTVIAAPDGSVAVAPFENPAMATGGTGDVLAGTIGALLAQGLAPYDAARLGVYLHGLAGEAVRDRIGDAGLLAGDLPDALPIGRKRLARIAERQRDGRRLGFGVRAEGSDAAAADAGTPAQAGPAVRRDAGRPALPPGPGLSGAAAPRASPSRRASRPPACRRCRAPPGWSSTSTRSRPTSRRSAAIVGPGGPRRARRQGRRLRARRGADRAGARRGGRGRALGRDAGRGVRAARRRDRAAAPRPVPDAARAGRGRRRLVDRGERRVGAADGRDPRGGGGGRRRWRARPRGARGGRDGPRAGRGAARRGRRRGPRRRRRAGRPPRRRVDAPRGGRRRLGHARAGRALRGRARRLVDTLELGPDAVRRHLAGSGGILGADADALGRRPARARDLRPGARRDRRRRPRRRRGVGGPAPGDGARSRGRCGSRTCRPVTASATGRRS